MKEIRRLDKQLSKATDIEAQLVALSTKKTPGDDNKSYKLRSHLCEVLSDVLISNPKVSLENDCFQRLWRGCFYNPIRIWRQRVSREKRKRSPTLATTQEGFKHFLSEAVTLYDYLVLQYLTKLVPSATQLDLTQQSRDIFDKSQLEDTQYASQSTEASEVSLEGVVHGLYKLYIFLGDLHRYAGACTKAESNYSNASKLGPGSGNPYNQLAVVAFSKDNYCVALYWYARSLLATHEKFSTSSNNLERLFASNREFLSEHGRNSIPTVFVNTSGGNGSKSKNRNSANMLRAQKAAAIKSCLTHFVDSHYDLYRRQEAISKEQRSTSGSSYSLVDESETKRLREKMKNVIASLKSLVQVSGFSDALLCKIVVINSFSWERASSAVGTVDISNCLAREYLFSLGIFLAEQVEKLLTKAIQRAAPDKALPSVRCLLPFEMLFDFVSMRLNCTSKDSRNGFDKDKTLIEIEFWKCASVVGTLVRKLLNCYKTSITGKKGSYLHSNCVTQIKEYQLLKGYRPFGVVNNIYLSNKDGFLNATEAVEVLELSAAQSASQDTCTISAMSVSTESGGRYENQAKLLRIVEICEHLVLPTSTAPLVFENDSYLYQETSPIPSKKPMLENGVVEEEECSNEGVNFNVDSDDEASDVVLHHDTKMVESREDHLPCSPSRVINPHSVVENTDFKADESPKTIEAANGDAIMTVAEEQPLRKISTTSIKPPPGFGGSIMLTPTSIPTTSVLSNSEPMVNYHPASISYKPTIDVPGLPSHSKNRNILDQVIQGRIPSANSSTPSFELPQQQQQSILPIPGLLPNSTRNEMLYPLLSERSNLPTSVEESIRIFGDMKTANPFVVDPPPSAFSIPANNQIINNHQNYNQNASIIPNFVSEDNYVSDDTKWLNSKLLDSLWMNESNKTENTWTGSE